MERIVSFNSIEKIRAWPERVWKTLSEKTKRPPEYLEGFEHNWSTGKRVAVFNWFLIFYGNPYFLFLGLRVHAEDLCVYWAILID